VPMTDKVSTILFANYSMLGDEAADSSLVEQRGSDNQGSLGVFVNYSF
jgi:outer membrane scaffolding protein for murein synthesis (MipA/OmpV family)